MLAAVGGSGTVCMCDSRGAIHVWISFGLESKYLHDLGSLVEMEAFA